MNNFQLPEAEIIKINKYLNKSDGIIAFPTDTVWGLGCLVGNNDAVEKIYDIKGRDHNKPLILLGSKIEYLVPYIDNIPLRAEEIMKKYFPGPVTLVLKKSDKTPSFITSGLDTVGIRIPDCPPFLKLLDDAVCGHVLATTSANLSGKGATALKTHVKKSLGNHVDYIVDDYGFLPKGMESTVVSVDENNNIKILRQGSVIIDL